MKDNIINKMKQENCCTPIGQIKRYVDCICCDKKPKQERSYTEEEVYSLLLKAIEDCYDEQLEHHYAGDYRNLKEWFKQNK